MKTRINLSVLYHKLLVIVLINLFFATYGVKAQELKLRIPIGGLYNTASVDFSPDGQFMIAAHMDNTFNIWDVESEKFIGGVLFEDAAPNSDVVARFSPKSLKDTIGGKYYFVLGDQSFVEVRETRTNDFQYQILHLYKDSLVHENCFIDFSPDGKYIVSAGEDNKIQVRDIENGRLKFVFDLNPFQIWHISFSPDAKYLISSTKYGNIKVWDLESGKLALKRIKLDQSIYSAQFFPTKYSKENQKILCELSDSSLLLWDVHKNKTIWRTNFTGEEISYPIFNNEGNLIMTIADNKAYILESSTGKCLLTLSGHSDKIIKALFLPGDSLLVTSSYDNKIIVWNLKDGSIKNTFISDEKDEYFNDLKINPLSLHDPSNHEILMGSSNGRSLIWDYENNRMLKNFESKINPIWQLQIDVDKQKGFFYSPKNHLFTFDLTNGQIIDQSKTSGLVNNMQVVENIVEGKSLFYSTNDTLYEFSNKYNGSCLPLLDKHFEPIDQFCINNQGTMLISSKDSNLTLWNLKDQIKIKSIIGHTGSINSLAFSENDSLIVSTSDDMSVKVWSASSLNPLWSVKIPKNKKGHTLTRAVFTKDGGPVLVGHNTGKISILYGDQYTKVLDEHSSAINHFTLSKDGSKILSSGSDKKVILWHNNKVSQQFNHRRDVSSAYFNVEETHIITSCYDGGIHYWDIQSGENDISFYLLENDPKKWVHIAKNGFFDASPEAMELLYWTKGLEIIEFTQLKDRYWIPGLWSKVMNKEKLPEIKGIQDLKLQPKVKFGDFRDGKLAVHLTRRDGGYGKMSLFINGKEISADARGDDFDPNKVEQTIYVDLKDHPNLINGENAIAVKTSSEDGFVVGWIFRPN